MLIKLFGKFGAIFILFVISLVLIIVTFKIRLSTLLTYFSNAVKLLGLFLQKILNLISTVIRNFINRIKSRPPTKVSDQTDIDPELQRTVDDSGKNIPDPNVPEMTIEVKGEQENIEIVHRNKYSDPRSTDGLSSDDVPDAEVLLEDEKTDKSPASFEIQEAHQERELDYDSLIRDSLSKYQFPSSELLIEHDTPDLHLSEEELKLNARLLEETLAQFGVRATVNRVVEGPVITLYEVKPAQGVKISQIVGLADDLALAMRAKGIRMIAPIPGKAAIGIEIPNRHPSIVYYKSIVRSETFINLMQNSHSE